MITKLAFHLSVYALIVAVSGCKQSRTSQAGLESLDNFAGVSSRANLCTANPNADYNPSDFPMISRIRFVGAVSEQMDSPLKNNLMNALVNIPREIQATFVAGGGMVVIADNSKELCGATGALNIAGNAEITDSCLVHIAKTDKHAQILHIVLPPDVSGIHHNIMRLAALFVADVVPLGSRSLADSVADFRSATAVAVLNDITSSQAFNSEKILNHIGSAGFIKVVKQSRGSSGVIDLSKLAQGISSADQKTARELAAFSRSAFVEAFDSYYCNSWSAVSPQVISEISRGNFAQINRVTNTRAVMQALFPASHKHFHAKGQLLLNQVAKMVDSGSGAKGALTSSEAGVQFSLDDGGVVTWDANGDGRYGPLETGASMIATFGKSLFWDQTTKPVANAYGRYSNRVVENWNQTGNVFSGYAGGISQTYKQEVWDPTQARTEAVFNRQVQGGATTNQAFRNTLAVELLRPTGTTSVMETTALGERFDGSQYRDNWQRASEFSFGVGGMAGTAAVPLSFMPKGTLPTAPGVVPTTTEVAGNASALQSIGVEAPYAARFASAFEGGATATTLPKGTVLYRVGGEGPGSWLSRTPIRDPINSLALPQASEATAGQLNRFVTTRPVQVVEGGVAPQPSWASPGNPKLGGANQIYMNRPDALGGALRQVPLETPLQRAAVPASGGTTTGNASGGTHNSGGESNSSGATGSPSAAGGGFN